MDYLIYLHFIIYIVSLLSSYALHLPFTSLPVYKFCPIKATSSCSFSVNPIGSVSPQCSSSLPFIDVHFSSHCITYHSTLKMEGGFRFL